MRFSWDISHAQIDSRLSPNRSRSGEGATEWVQTSDARAEKKTVDKVISLNQVMMEIADETDLPLVLIW